MVEVGNRLQFLETDLDSNHKSRLPILQLPLLTRHRDNSIVLPPHNLPTLNPDRRILPDHSHQLTDTRLRNHLHTASRSRTCPRTDNNHNMAGRLSKVDTNNTVNSQRHTDSSRIHMVALQDTNNLRDMATFVLRIHTLHYV